MGNGLQGTLLPVRANIEAFSATDIGILGSAYFFGFAGGCLFGPRLIRRAGHIRAFAALGAVASCVVLVHSLFLAPLLWRSEQRRVGKERVRTFRSRWSPVH